MQRFDLDRKPAPRALPSRPEDFAALDATIAETDWPLIQHLWRAGWTNTGIYRLLHLRATRRSTALSADPAAPDARTHFARWLVTTGRLNEAA